MKMIHMLFWTLLAAPLFAGITYEAETVTTNEKGKPSRMLVTVHVEGDKARIEFREVGSKAYQAKQGNYILTKDAGETMIMVDPKEKTYMDWDMGQLMAMAGGMFQLEFENPSVKMLEESSGDPMLGHQTRRYKFKSSYGMSMKMGPVKSYQDIETETEAWTTSDYSNEALRAWMGVFPKTGMKGLDSLMEEHTKAIKGFPLKTKTKTVTKQYNRKRTKVKRSQTTYSEQIVKTIKEGAIEASTFEVPAGYTKMESPAESMGGLKNMFNRQ